MTSIAQIVSEIIDALSDGISNLVLLIVQLKEQNAQMPEGVPKEAKKTTQNAVQLAQVGMLLAEKDYADFPDIAKEIRDASKDTIEATALLSNSIESLSDSDRKKGWEGILQSCSVMAERTIKLLQIVYGAELKKLLSLNDSLNKVTNDLDPIYASTNPEEFANNTTEAGQKAVQIAKLLNALSKGDQFPWLKEKLAQLSDDLIKDAQNLVDSANELLEDPDDPTKKKLFEDAKNKLLRTLADMLKSINESPLSDSAISNTFVPLNTEALKSIRPNQSELDKAIKDIKDLLNQLINAAKNGDKDLYDNLLSQLSKKINEAKSLALKQASALSGNPERHEPLIDLLNELENIIPPNIDEAKKLNDDKDFSKLFDATQRLKDLTNKLLDRISNAARPNGILENIKKIEDELEKAKANINEGKGNDVKNRLEPLNKQINDEVINMCNMIQDNDRRNDILEALDRLKRAFSKLCDCKTPEEFDKAMKEYLDALHQISKLTDAPKLGAIQNLKAETMILQSLEDPESIQRSANRLVDLGNKIMDLSDDKDSEELKDFEKALKNELESAIEVLNNPDSKDAKIKLEETSIPLLKTAFALEKKIINPQVCNYYDVLQTKDNVNDIDDSIRKLLETLSKLKGIIPDIGTDKDEEAKEELKKLVPNIKKLAIRSNNNITDNKNDLAIASLEQAKKCNELLLDSIKKGDEARIINQSKALSNNVIQTIGLLESLDNIDDKKQQINALSDELKSKLAEALRKLKEIVVNDDENKDQEPVKEILSDINNTIDRTKTVIYDPSHDEKNMRDNSDKIKNKLKVIKAIAKEGDKQGVESQLQKLDNNINKFTRAARKRRIYNVNNNKEDDETLKEFLELARKIGHLSRELAENPNNKDTEELYATIETAIQHKMNEIKEKESVNEISCLQDIEDAISSIQDGVRQNDALIINKAAKDAVSKMNYLSEILNNHADPQKKDQLEESFRDLGNNIKELLRTASRYHNEEKKEDKDKLNDIVSASKVKIAKMIGVLTRSRDKKSTPEHIRIAQRNPTDENAILKALESTYILATKENDLHKRDLMEKSIIDVSNKQEEYQNNPTNSNKKELENSLQNLYNEVMNDCIDNEIDSYADLINQTSNINVEDDKNLNEDCSKLKDSLENHIKATMEVSRQKKGIYANVNDKESKKSISDLGKEIKSINIESTKKRKEHVEEPKTFEEVLEHVANDIQEAIGDSTQSSDAAEIVSGSGIVYELRRLAEAARKGNASEMLLAAKAVANHLKEIIQEIKDVVNRMGSRNPREQEKLLKSSVALNNYGTQMKILTSVKASSIKENTDNDETLLSITRSLGSMLTDTIKTIDTVKIAVLKEK